MTAHRNRVPPTTCCIRAATSRVMSAIRAKVYTQCYPHMKETWNRNWKNTGKQRRTERGRSKPSRFRDALPVPSTLFRIAYMCWPSIGRTIGCIEEIEGRVVAVDAMPPTEGEWIDMQKARRRSTAC